MVSACRDLTSARVGFGQAMEKMSEEASLREFTAITALDEAWACITGRIIKGTSSLFWNTVVDVMANKMMEPQVGKSNIIRAIDSSTIAFCTTSANDACFRSGIGKEAADTYDREVVAKRKELCDAIRHALPAMVSSDAMTRFGDKGALKLVRIAHALQRGRS